MVLQPQADQLWVTGTPVNPFCTEKSPDNGPLAGLFLLDQATDHAVCSVSRQEAVPKLTAEVILPLGLMEPDLNRGLARSLDRALKIYRTGMVQKLRFRRDSGFWPLLLAPIPNEVGQTSGNSPLSVARDGR
jgi:hypothetical protein